LRENGLQVAEQAQQAISVTQTESRGDSGASMEMETDGPDEDQLLMLSKAPSMTMLNEREVRPS
jgi:hypothetical protein